MNVSPAQSFHLDRLAENQLPALAWVFRKAGRAALSRPVSLDKATDVHWGTINEPGFEAERRIARKTQRPPVGAPLHDHREGLRANDMTVLHSALWILAVRGGTAHLAPIPGSVDRNGDIVPVNF